MNADELIALFRTETADIEMPYLWTDEEAVTYLNDAYTMFTRFLGGVADSTSPFTTVEFTTGDKSIPLDASIIRIVRAFRVSDGVEISVIESTDTPLVRTETGKLQLLRVGSHSAALVDFLVLGSDMESAALHPLPSAAGAIHMHVRRIPYEALTSGAVALVDIRAEHHIHLVKWMKALAYRKQDVETFDLDKAETNEQGFLQYCSQAVHEQERMRRKSRVSLRSERDIKNPMLTAGAYRAYGERGGSGGGSGGQGPTGG